MRFGRRRDMARRRWRLSAKLLIASSVATVIGFSTICASVMLDMRRGEEELARQTLFAAGIDMTSAATSRSSTCRCAPSPTAWCCRKSRP